MSGEIIGIVLLVIALIAGPFAALRAVSYYRARRSSSAPPAGVAKEDENPDDKSSFW